jgi:hypothetical protein
MCLTFGIRIVQVGEQIVEMLAGVTVLYGDKTYQPHGRGNVGKSDSIRSNTMEVPASIYGFVLSGD